MYLLSTATNSCETSLLVVLLGVYCAHCSLHAKGLKLQMKMQLNFFKMHFYFLCIASWTDCITNSGGLVVDKLTHWTTEGR